MQEPLLLPLQKLVLGTGFGAPGHPLAGWRGEFEGFLDALDTESGGVHANDGGARRRLPLESC